MADGAMVLVAMGMQAAFFLLGWFGHAMWLWSERQYRAWQNDRGARQRLEVYKERTRTER